MKFIQTNLSANSSSSNEYAKSPIIDFSVAGTALTIDPNFGQYLSAGDQLVVLNGGTGGYPTGTILNVLNYGGATLDASTGTVDVGVTGSTGTVQLLNWEASTVISVGENSIKYIENAALVEVSNLYINALDTILVSVLPVDLANSGKWTQITFSLESVVDVSTGLPVSDAVVQLQYVDIVNFKASEFATLANMMPGDVFMTSGLYPAFGESNQNTNITSIMGVALYNASLSTEYYVTGTLILSL
jgi:hypothetical protein